MTQSLAQRLVSERIKHDGGKCPCVGEYIRAYYDDGSVEIGFARDTVHWRYVSSYRLIAEPVRDV